jgi:phage-related protein
MASFREIILRTVGDGDDARRDLEQTAAELRAFDRIKAEATAELDTARLKAQLKDAQARLDALSAVEATPEVSVATAQAKGEIRALQTRLAELAAKDYNVDVNIDPDGLGRSRLEAAAAGARDADGAFGRFAQSLRDSRTLFRASLIALVGSVAPLIPVLATATLALGAVAIAAVGAAAAFAPLLVGAILAVSKGIPGTEAQVSRLKAAFSKLGDEFKRIAAPGVNALFRGLTPLIGAVTGSLDKLQPGMTAIGEAMGQAFKDSIPQVRTLIGEFGKLMTASAPLAGPLVSSLVSIFRILVNIARAAMPFLIEGFRNVAQTLRSWAGATSNVSAVRKVIADWLPDLKAVWGLLKSLGGALVAVFAPLRSSGQETVKTLTDMVNGFTDWARSAEGQEQISAFFSQTFFALQDVVRLLFALAPLIAPVTKAMGSFATLALKAFTGFADALGPLGGAFKGLSLGVAATGFAAVKLGPLLLFMQRAGAFSGIAKAVGGGFALMGRAAAAAGALMLANPVIAIAALVAVIVLLLAKFGLLDDVWNAIKTGFDAVVGAIEDAIGWFNRLPLAAKIALAAIALAVAPVLVAIAAAVLVVRNFSAIWEALKSIAASVFSAVKSAAQNGLLGPVALIIARWQQVIAIIGSIIGAAKSAFNAVKNAATTAANAVKAAISVAWNFVRDKILAPVTAAWRWIGEAARNVASAVRSTISNLVSAVGSAVSRAAGAAWHWILDAAKSVATGVRNVINDVVGWVKRRLNDLISAAGDIASKIANAIKGPVNAVIDGLNNIKLPGVNIHVAIPHLPDVNFRSPEIDPFPGNIPHLARGVRNFVGGLALVGEEGPELAHLPRGTSVFPTGETPGGVTFNITTPDGGAPDVETFLAQADSRLRTRSMG